MSDGPFGERNDVDDVIAERQAVALRVGDDYAGRKRKSFQGLQQPVDFAVIRYPARGNRIFKPGVDAVDFLWVQEPGLLGIAADRDEEEEVGLFLSSATFLFIPLPSVYFGRWK